MPPNLRKSQPNLSKPSEGGSFTAGKKPSEETSPLRSLNLTGERELGSAGGVKATGKLTVGVDDLIGQQGVQIEIDATNRTAGFGADIGSTKGKLGVNIGGKVGYDETGKISIKGAEVGVNIGGFGGSASIGEDEGIRGSIGVAGAKVEIGVGKDGKKTLSLCYGVPGGELCVTCEPDPGISPPTPATTDPSIDNENKGFSAVAPMPNLKPNCYYTMIVLVLAPGEVHKNCLGYGSGDGSFGYSFETISRDGPFGHFLAGVEYNENYRSYEPVIKTKALKGAVFSRQRGWVQVIKGSLTPVSENPNGGNGVEKGGSITGLGGYATATLGGMGNSNWSQMFQWILKSYNNGRNDYTSYDYIPIESCPNGIPNTPIFNESPSFPTSPSLGTDKIQLPNYPQYIKPTMDCCDKIDEIYRFLGIGKLKKNKFPVSNAFLVPGGSGNDNCLDYYSIMQALFRMLANGLIINPKSKPLGSEWQNANATAWASGMYEMMAESMSDGNSSQRFEVAAIMQLAQIMATLAENGRKIEFMTDAIGFEPLLVPEELPICFTIYEGHKGFGKKEPKKINVSKLKTDDAVENALGKMLSPSVIPITAWKFKPGQISINEALRNNG